VTSAAILCAGLVAIAAALAVGRATLDDDHGPIAALLLLYALDPLRPEHGGAAMTWALALPALSAGAAVAVLARARLGALIASTVVLGIGSAELQRSGSPASALLLASGLSVVAQAMAAIVASGRRLGLAARCALLLLAGDVAALAGPLGDIAHVELQRQRWWLAQWQGAAVAAVLCVLHLTAARPSARHA
jgi:hypothetical protein